MGQFNSRDKDGFDRGKRSFGGRSDRSGGRGGFGRDRGSARDGRRMELHNAVCSKCGKRCQVPFKPTGEKPVYCSECFSSDSGSRNDSRGERTPQSQGGGASSEQLKQINAKLDKILAVLSELELDTGDEDLEEIDEELEDN